MSSTTGHIETVLKENRHFPPSKAFTNNAELSNPDAFEQLYQDAKENPVAFWEGAASDVHWFKKWTKVLEWNEPFSKWFVGATTNAAYNCLDRHVESGKKEKL